MLNSVSFLFTNFKYNLKKELENKRAFVFKIFVCILNDVSFFALWKIFLLISPNIGNADFNTIMMIWAVACAVHGISRIFFENVYYLPQIISTHSLDYYITKPQNVLYALSISKIQVESFGDVIYGFLLFFIFGKIQTLPLFLTLTVLGAISMTAFNAIVGSLAFWIKSAGAVAYNAHFTLICASTYPADIFKGFARVLFLTIIPSTFICHLPVAILNKFSIKDLLTVIAFTIVICLFANFVFKSGLKRYFSQI